MSKGLVVELFAHMAAGDRTKWTADQDTRPLSELGRLQAQRLCDELANSPFDALYSSPALRSRQSIEPLAERFELPIVVLPGLHETESWLPPAAWRSGPDQLGGSYAAGSGMHALRTIRANHGGGRVAACTHGDILPSLVVFLMGAYALELPGPNATRGGWYTLVFEGDDVRVEHHDVLPDFPQ